MINIAICDDNEDIITISFDIIFLDIELNDSIKVTLSHVERADKLTGSTITNAKWYEDICTINY